MSKESLLEELAQEAGIVGALYDEISQAHFRDPELAAERRETLEQIYLATVYQYRVLESKVNCTFDEKELNERAFAELEALIKRGVHADLFQLGAIRTVHGMHNYIAHPVMALTQQLLEARLSKPLEWDIPQRYKIPLRIAQYRLGQELRRMNILHRNIAQSTERAEALVGESRTLSYFVKEHLLGLDIMRRKTKLLSKQHRSQEGAKESVPKIVEEVSDDVANDGTNDIAHGHITESRNEGELHTGILTEYLLYRAAPIASVLVGVPLSVALGHPIIGGICAAIGVLGECADIALHGKYKMYVLAPSIQRTLALGKG